VPLDPDYPAERLEFMLKDCAPVAVLMESSTKTALTGGDDQITKIDLTHEQSKWNYLPNTNLERCETYVSPGNLAYIISSAQLDLRAMVEHGGVVNRLNWMQRRYLLNQDDAVLQKHTVLMYQWEFF
jgi:arthrofactin-type cyclic lipopeptide synthetase B